MLKKSIAGITAALMVFSLVGCGNTAAKNDVDEKESQPVLSYSDGLTEDGYFENVEVSEYVTLPEGYETLDIPLYLVKADDGEWDMYLRSVTDQHGELLDIKDLIQPGDTVVMDFSGTVDGKAFVGSEAKDIEFIAGSGNYLPEIEKSVLEHKVGDEYTVDVTFPSGYPSSEDTDGNEFVLEKKTAVFTINVKSVTRKVLTDKAVQETFADMKSIDGGDVKTVDDLKKDYIARLERSLLEQAVNLKINEVSSVKEVPSNLKDHYVNMELQLLDDTYAKVGFSSKESFLQQNGFESLEKYKEYLYSMADSTLKSQMVLLAVAQDNNIKLDKSLADKVFSSPYETLAETYGAPYVNQNILMYQALSFLRDKAVIDKTATEPPVEEATSQPLEADDSSSSVNNAEE